MDKREDLKKLKNRLIKYIYCGICLLLKPQKKTPKTDPHGGVK